MTHLETAFPEPKGTHYTVQQRLLRMVNGKKSGKPAVILPRRIAAVRGNQPINLEKGAAFCEGARSEIFESFAVENDVEHAFIQGRTEGVSDIKQRAIRAFVVLIDKKYTNPDTNFHESFYGEGQASHRELLASVITLAREYGIGDLPFNEEEVEKESSSPAPRWLVFKGFLLANRDELENIPFSDHEEILRSFALRKRGLETNAIADENGPIEIDEAMGWFLTSSKS